LLILPRIKILPAIFILIFLAPLAGKSFHHHDEHRTTLPVTDGLVLENICPVCQYEICSFDVQVRHDAGQSVVFQDIILVDLYKAPITPRISLSFLLRAPPSLL